MTTDTLELPTKPPLLTLDEILLVIDMQPSYDAANHPETLAAVMREIEDAKAKGHGIYVVEFDYAGKSHQKIYDATFSYALTRKVTKHADDGSLWILEQLDRDAWTTKKFKVTGVNIDYCVASTVRGIAAKRPGTYEIEVVKDACYGQDHGRTWWWVKDHTQKNNGKLRILEPARKAA